VLGGERKIDEKTDRFSKNRQATAATTTPIAILRQTPLRRSSRRQFVIKIHYDIMK